jgi:hypothetical protein
MAKVRGAFQFRESVLDEKSVLLAVEHIQQSYHPACALKLLIPNRQDALEGRILQVGTMLTTKRSHPATQAIFTLDTNLTYINPVLDNFLKWGMECVVNVMYIHPQDSTSQIALEDMISFWLKMSSRDHSNNLVLLFSIQPTAEEKQFIRLRFRNYLSICFMGAPLLAMTCLNKGRVNRSPAAMATEFQVIKILRCNFHA